VTRTALTLVLLAGLSLWASAQDQTVAREIRQLNANRLLLDQLIDHGLRISDEKDGGDPLVRADEYRQAAATLASALKAADQQKDLDPAARVAELSDHVTALVRDGLVPSLDEANGSIPVGSKARDRLKDLSDRAAKELTDLGDSFPTGGKFDRSDVAEARRKLAEARKKLAEARERIDPPQK
jgi:hypothetical protein